MTMASLPAERKKRCCVCGLLIVEIVLLVSTIFAAGPVASVSVQRYERHRQQHQQEPHRPRQQQYQKRSLQIDKKGDLSFLHSLSAEQLELQGHHQLQAQIRNKPPINNGGGAAYEKEDSLSGSGRLSSGRSPPSSVASFHEGRSAHLEETETSYLQRHFQNEKDTEASVSSAALRHSHDFRSAGPHLQDVGGSGSFGGKSFFVDGGIDHALSANNRFSSSGLQSAAVTHGPISHHAQAAHAAPTRVETSSEVAAGGMAVGEGAAGLTTHAHAASAGNAARAIHAATAAAIDDDDPHGEAASAGALAGVHAAGAPTRLSAGDAAGVKLPENASVPASPSNAGLERKHVSLSRQQSSRKAAVSLEQQHARSVDTAASKLAAVKHSAAAAFASLDAKGKVTATDPVVASLSTVAKSAFPTSAPSTARSPAATLSSLPSTAADFRDIRLGPVVLPLSAAASSVPVGEEATAARLLPAGPPLLLSGPAQRTAVGTAPAAGLNLVDAATPSAVAAEVPPLSAPAGTAEQASASLSTPEAASVVTALPSYPVAATPSVPSDPLSGAAPPALALPAAAATPSPPFPADPAAAAQARALTPPAAATSPAGAPPFALDPVTGNTNPSEYVALAPPAPSVPLPSTAVLTASATSLTAAPASAAPAAPAAPPAVASGTAVAPAPASAAPAAVPAAPAAPYDAALHSGVAPASEAAPAPAAVISDAGILESAADGAVDAAARAVTHAAAHAADPAAAAPPPSAPAPAAAETEDTNESVSSEGGAAKKHKVGDACFDACSCWPVWSLGILLLVLNLTASFVAFYHTASLFSRGLLSSQFYRGGGYWLLGVAALGFTTGGLIGGLVPPSCWAGALYLGGCLMSLFLSFVLIGRRGALLGSFGGVGAGGVIGYFTQTGSLGIVIGMVLGLLFGIVVGFAPICRGLKINERYVRASLGAERRLRRGRYSEDLLDKSEKSSTLSSSLRGRFAGSPRESHVSPPRHSSEYLLPPLDNSAVVPGSSAAAETTASINSAAADAGLKDGASGNTEEERQLDMNDSVPASQDRRRLSAERHVEDGKSSTNTTAGAAPGAATDAAPFPEIETQEEHAQVQEQLLRTAAAVGRAATAVVAAAHLAAKISHLATQHQSALA